MYSLRHLIDKWQYIRILHEIASGVVTILCPSSVSSFNFASDFDTVPPEFLLL